MREFYTGVLGLPEVPKPATMNRARGAWFRGESVEIHAIPDPDFQPNRLGHPAMVVDDLDELRDRFISAGHEIVADDRFPGHRRFHAFDCFGNQLEFLQPIEEASA